MRCFIAIKFGRQDTDRVYDKLIKKTLVKQNITPIRIDRKLHNNDIDDEILHELKKCDFVIADLTYASPSVYFEAGFGAGYSVAIPEKPKPVIFTCRKDHLSRKMDDEHGNFRVHFDLQMKNIIPWIDDKDKKFEEDLVKRISFVCKPIIKQQRQGEEEKQKIDFFNERSSFEKQYAILEKGYSILKRNGLKPKMLESGYPYQYHRGLNKNYNIVYPRIGIYLQKLKPNLIIPIVLSKQFSRGIIQTFYLHISSKITKTLVQYLYQTLLSRPIYNLSPPAKNKIEQLVENLIICSPSSFCSKKVMEYIPELYIVDNSFVYSHSQIVPNSKSSKWKEIFYINENKFEGYHQKDKNGFLKSEEFAISGNYLTHSYQGKNYQTIQKNIVKLKEVPRILQINILDSIKHEDDFTNRFKNLVSALMY